MTEYVNFECKCRFAAWLARLANRSNLADQPSHWGSIRSGYVTQKGLH